MPATQSRVNDFVLKIATVNGTGSASANGLLLKALFRMGVPVTGKNLFPSNIQGQQGRLHVAHRPRGRDGGHERADL
jgi:Pyruvate/2-oxoacid:ferredoxin oxidoreductase gamma subunit